MLDIDKYLESQKLLAKNFTQFKSSSTIPCTQKNIEAAERISKKQFIQHRTTDCKYRQSKRITSRKSSSCEGRKNEYQRSSNEDDSNSEYIPSDDDMSDDSADQSLKKIRKPHLHSANKILDDGDKNTFNERINLWRSCKRKVKENIAKGENVLSTELPIYTVDIEFMMENKSIDNKYYILDGSLKIPLYIWQRLYTYQRSGLKWLWELHQIDSGGLLGDEMGLGKTVQIIALLASLNSSDYGKWHGLGPSIIVVPATVLYQWVSHFHYWYPPLRIAALHTSGTCKGKIKDLIREIHKSCGILIVTYVGIINYHKDLLNLPWDYLILDEGHKIRNHDTQISKIVKRFKTPHRIIISGSPMQNNLQELWSLFDFMSPGLLGSLPTFLEHFAFPITQGGYANATSLQEVTALEIAKSLKKIITPYMIRRTKGDVKEYLKLPDKNEQVLFCSLTSEQRDIYLAYLHSSTVRGILDKECRYRDPLRARILVALSTLRKICNHPDLFLHEVDESEEIPDENFGHWKRSGKMLVVNSLLKIWKKQGHRALLFTQSRAMLCLIEIFLQQNNYEYLKMDGSVSVASRQNIIKLFNSNNKYLVFLATTRVGGLGVNLTGADRVIIYDPDWNPATDSQAKERAWRIGQLRNVTVYRLLLAGTIEEKIYQRQVFKQLLSNKVLLDPNQKHLLSTSTLQGLFTLEEPNKNGDTETPAIFKHTKINMETRKEVPTTSKNLSGAFSLSKTRVQALNDVIKLNTSIICNTPDVNLDLRERYKKKREILLQPTKIEEPEPTNKVDNEITNESFNVILSELDIINMHTKKDYVDNLINSVEFLPQSNTENKASEQTLDKDDTSSISNICSSHNSTLDSQSNTAPCLESPNNKRKLREKKIDNVLYKKKWKEIKRDKEQTQDDYVLSKLFAKYGVTNALEHDKIIGLQEKEEKHRLQEEAKRNANLALRALKKSRRTIKD